MDGNLVHAIAGTILYQVARLKSVGAGGGIISMTLTYPLITIGTRLQVQKSPTPSSGNTSNSSTSEIKPLSKKQYAGFWDAVDKIYRFEGIQGFYVGIHSALFGIALTQGVYYYFYEWVKAAIDRRRARLNLSGGQTVLESLASGALAGCMTVLITNPVWVVNTRMTTGKGSKSIDDEDSPNTSPKNSSDNIATATAPTKKSMMKHSKSSWALAYDIVKEDGIGALWQGVMPALILVSNPSIQYMVFEQLKQRLETFRKNQGSSSSAAAAALTQLDFFVLGAISKLVATFMTYPYIVIKSRMQLKQSSTSATSTSTSSTGPYATTVQSFRTILRQEGPVGLYKGVESKLLQSVLTAAILFWAKEKLVDVTQHSLVLVLAWVGTLKQKRI